MSNGLLQRAKEWLTATEPLQLTARAVNVDRSDTTKPATVEIVAYGGGEMSPPGFGLLVIDLAGLRLPEAIPLLADHRNELNAVAGTGRPKVANNQLLVVGTLDRSGKAGERVIELSRSGVQLGASVGVEPGKREYIREGTTVQVNGRTITAGMDGLTIIRTGVLREVSFVAIGADESAGVSQVKAGMQTMHSDLQDPKFIAWGRDMIGAHFDKLDETGLAGLRATYEGRPAPVDNRPTVENINAICGGEYGNQQERVEELRIQALAGDIGMEALRDGVLEALRASRPQGHTVYGRGSSHAQGPGAIEAALLIRAGKESLAEATLGPRVMESSRSLHNASLVDLCRAACEMNHMPTGGLGRTELIRAGLSTNSMSVALSNATGKTLLESYRESTGSWRGFARVMPAADFKPQVGIRPSFMGQLEIVGAGGEIEHGSLTESTYPWRIDTFAKQLQISRQDMINDDLGFINQTAPLMGKMAARAVNDLVWSTILANGGNFFASGNGNLLEAGSELSLGSVATAVAAMRKQRDADGNDIDILPRVLAVPPELEATARAIINSAEVQPGLMEGITAPTGNALRNIAELVVESRLSNSDKFANAAADGWYLFAGPMDASVIVGFLDGRENPTVEFFPMTHDINRLAIGWRVYHDFGCALGDHRAAVKATGEASDT